ncbi:uncharacterized protein LOC109537566 isoform X1 [Dendroctonus ponderosae]|nr:uncharacterized protein LOC109537566 isoform X1 [Dendroctonus ponderosae]XP_048518450.1 uncharacterized protein LOC109537566 isoform X1 [Dendroctonus ponderosae]KAH1004785.1 hypothetical protein HUJ05_005560 [Dendroctonus ponderosae]
MQQWNPHSQSHFSQLNVKNPSFGTMEQYWSRSSHINSRTHTLEGLTLSSNQAVRSNEPSNDEIEYIGDPQLIAIVGDEDTCVGFLLAGIGQTDESFGPNFIVVGPKMDDFQLELMFLDLLERPDIGLLLITKEAAGKIPHVIGRHTGMNPTIMIIPGHNGPFEFDLPLAVKEIEERRQANGRSRSGSLGSSTSVKTNESINGGCMGKKVSTHSLRSVLSTRSI